MGTLEGDRYWEGGKIFFLWFPPLFSSFPFGKRTLALLHSLSRLGPLVWSSRLFDWSNHPSPHPDGRTQSPRLGHHFCFVWLGYIGRVISLIIFLPFLSVSFRLNKYHLVVLYFPFFSLVSFSPSHARRCLTVAQHIVFNVKWTQETLAPGWCSFTRIYLILSHYKKKKNPKFAREVGKGRSFHPDAFFQPLSSCPPGQRRGEKHCQPDSGGLMDGGISCLVMDHVNFLCVCFALVCLPCNHSPFMVPLTRERTWRKCSFHNQRGVPSHIHFVFLRQPVNWHTHKKVGCRSYIASNLFELLVQFIIPGRGEGGGAVSRYSPSPAHSLEIYTYISIYLYIYFCNQIWGPAPPTFPIWMPLNS